MQPNATDFQWTGKKLRAVELVADDSLSDAEIAATLGVNKTTLERWKRDGAFAERVNEARVAIVAALRAEGIALKQNRIDRGVLRADQLEQVRAERGADPKMADVPGGSTGWLVADLKLVKHLDNSDAEAGQRVYQEEFWVYAVDTPLLKEIREIEKQVAVETGQWEEKQAIGGELLLRRYVGVDPDDV